MKVRDDNDVACDPGSPHVGGDSKSNLLTALSHFASTVLDAPQRPKNIQITNLKPANSLAIADAPYSGAIASVPECDFDPFIEAPVVLAQPDAIEEMQRDQTR